jgi:DNA invertase Pin-like site-specific DNA recombinase
MICERVNAGFARAREEGVRFGCKPVDSSIEKRIQTLRAMGILKIGKTVGVGTSVVRRVIPAT